ncbi:Hypothetical protein HVR_LOCUS914, partial [uncultured virus]
VEKVSREDQRTHGGNSAAKIVILQVIVNAATRFFPRPQMNLGRHVAVKNVRIYCW